MAIATLTFASCWPKRVSCALIDTYDGECACPSWRVYNKGISRFHDTYIQYLWVEGIINPFPFFSTRRFRCWLECCPPIRKVGCSIPGRNRLTSLEQVVTFPPPLRSATSLKVTRRWPSKRMSRDTVAHTFGNLKNPDCSTQGSVQHWSKFAALYRQRWRLCRGEIFSRGAETTYIYF